MEGERTAFNELQMPGKSGAFFPGASFRVPARDIGETPLPPGSLLDPTLGGWHQPGLVARRSGVPDASGAPGHILDNRGIRG